MEKYPERIVAFGYILVMRVQKKKSQK